MEGTLIALQTVGVLVGRMTTQNGGPVPVSSRRPKTIVFI